MMSSIFHFVWMVPRFVDILDLKKRRVFTMGGGNFIDDFKLNAIKQSAERDSGGVFSQHPPLRAE